jgi:hypothetical protein
MRNDGVPVGVGGASSGMDNEKEPGRAQRRGRHRGWQTKAYF